MSTQKSQNVCISDGVCYYAELIRIDEERDVARSSRENFIHCLKFWMKYRGVSPAELANRVGKSQGQISQWINGTKYPRPEMNDKIAEALKILPGDLNQEPFARRMWEEYLDKSSNTIHDRIAEHIVATEIANGHFDDLSAEELNAFFHYLKRYINKAAKRSPLWLGEDQRSITEVIRDCYDGLKRNIVAKDETGFTDVLAEEGLKPDTDLTKSLTVRTDRLKPMPVLDPMEMFEDEED